MKRVRSDEEKEEAAAAVDWTRLFHMECILSVLHPHLSTPDLIRLSLVNKTMSTTWINNERRLSVLNMRERIFRLLGRRYNVKNPIASVKRLAAKSRVSPKFGAKRFKCWRCNSCRTVNNLVTNRERWKYATCLTCAHLSMTKHYVNVKNVTDLYWHIIGQSGLLRKGRRTQFDRWYRKETQNLQKILDTQCFDMHFSSTDMRSYIHKSFIKPFMDDAVANCCSAE